MGAESSKSNENVVDDKNAKLIIYYTVTNCMTATSFKEEKTIYGPTAEVEAEFSKLKESPCKYIKDKYYPEGDNIYKISCFVSAKLMTINGTKII